MKKVFLLMIVFGLMLLFGGIWGGAWLCEHFVNRYQFASFITGCITSALGIGSIAIGCEGLTKDSD